MIIAGTGSRSLITENLEKRKNVMAAILTVLDEHGHGEPVQVMSGMAEGFDEALAEAAVRLRLPLHAVVPNYGYGLYYWGRNSQLGKDRFDLFQSYLAYAAENGSVEYVIEGVYNTTGVSVKGVHSNMLRNARMVERADMFVGYNPKKSAGTSNCIKLIEKAGKPLVMIT